MGDTSEKKEVSTIGQSMLEKFRQLSKEKEDELKGKPHNAQGEKRKIEEAQENEKELHIGLSEANVGITEYISLNDGFTGIIKHRFSDFQVNEIDPDGNVVELTSLELPEVVKEKPADPDFKKVLTNEQWEELERIANGEEANILDIEVTDKTKEERSAIHKAVKFIYTSVLYSNTIEKDGIKLIRIGKSTQNKERERLPGSFLHFTLYKENMDTTQTVHALAKLLRTKTNLISYAGNKDKRAKTTQRMCVKQRSADVLGKLKIPRVTIGNYKYHNKSLRLGQLSGNRFRIAIRDVKADDTVINNAMESLKEKGFINYFGLQRFGSSSIVPTYDIGKTLLSSDWKEAIELILKPKKGEKCPHDLRKARETWMNTGDAVKAAKFLSKYDNSVEGKILQTLKSQGNNAFINALHAIPRNMLTLYLHSYQSLIWNKIVSRRIDEFGLKPIVGDLVEVQTVPEKVEEEEKEVDDEKSVENEEKGETEDEVIEEAIEEKGKGLKIELKKLTADDLDTTSIFDIVYPLPGHNICYPNNKTALWYKELLETDGLDVKHWRNSQKIFSTSGTYRRMVGKVSDLNWESVYYQDINEDLILSDLDRIKNVTLHNDDNSDEKLHKAILMDFKLKPSHYATMVLREIMKCETSGSHQASLSFDHKSVVKCKKIKT